MSPDLVKRETGLVNRETGLVKREADLVKRDRGVVCVETSCVICRRVPFVSKHHVCMFKYT